MPFINMKTNLQVTKEQKERVKQKLGKAIELIPGKSEEWLMVAIDDNISLYFKGKADKPIAFVEVKIFGSTTEEAYQLVTAQITHVLNEELSISPDQIFVAYAEVEHWGWNGNNF
ncbi:MAG: hypothetical protein K0R34_3035 [Herbinix sp.]|jgi:phenylpyruvate tautomerase PptA (4-oxalocrotonate tautomerase family)|nr:hypothetical protein [Herbinix sp.]